MTTAGRPTFNPAKGGGSSDLSKLSKQYSSRDLPGHTKLKYRQTGQASSEEIYSKDFKRELEEKEKSLKASSKLQGTHQSKGNTTVQPKKLKGDQNQNSLANLDADDPIEDDDDDTNYKDNDSEGDDDEEMAELMAELQRIKKERMAEQSKKEMEMRVEQEKIRTENILSGNPLIGAQQLTSTTGFKVKRRWDDDVVFKNCAKGDMNKSRHFINDIVRSEFHKRFMDKYVK